MQLTSRDYVQVENFETVLITHKLVEIFLPDITSNILTVTLMLINKSYIVVDNKKNN